MKSILLVDDDPGVLDTLRDILTRFGYSVIAETDAASALAKLRSGAKFDLVISDYRMPVMDGLDFLAFLRQIDTAVPVIMLTAYGDVESYLKALSLGAYEYIAKPVRSKELGRIVQAALKAPHAGTGTSMPYHESP